MVVIAHPVVRATSVTGASHCEGKSLDQQGRNSRDRDYGMYPGEDIGRTVKIDHKSTADRPLLCSVIIVSNELLLPGLSLVWLSQTTRLRATDPVEGLPHATHIPTLNSLSADK